MTSLLSYLNPFAYISNPFFLSGYVSGYGGRAPSVTLVKQKNSMAKYPVLTDEILANARRSLKPIKSIELVTPPDAPDFPDFLIILSPPENVGDEIRRHGDNIKPSLFKRE